MACAKCGKKKIRTVLSIVPSVCNDGGADNTTYAVQSRKCVAIDSVGRLLPGERLQLEGSMVCSVLAVDPSVFIFISGSEKRQFLSKHLSLVGRI
jgi:ribosomal protein L40E